VEHPPIALLNIYTAHFRSSLLLSWTITGIIIAIMIIIVLSIIKTIIIITIIITMIKTAIITAITIVMILLYGILAPRSSIKKKPSSEQNLFVTSS
jgi:hypothetical protein